jgi:hypothetical protein
VTPAAPAPWRLHGYGYVLLWRFDPVLRRFADGRPAHGLGAVMLVNYLSSPVGPYGEVLQIPGWSRYLGRPRWGARRVGARHVGARRVGARHYSIARIYVSTAASLENGRRNWGIPKEQARIEFRRIDPHRERISAWSGGEPILEAVLRSGILPIPLSASLFPARLLQVLDGRGYRTRISGWGLARPARLESLSVNPDRFPDPRGSRPALAVCIRPFSIYFPPAVS